RGTHQFVGNGVDDLYADTRSVVERRDLVDEAGRAVDGEPEVGQVDAGSERQLPRHRNVGILRGGDRCTWSPDPGCDHQRGQERPKNAADGGEARTSVTGSTSRSHRWLRLPVAVCGHVWT